MLAASYSPRKARARRIPAPARAGWILPSQCWPGTFTGLRIFRLTDPEAERFDQVALFYFC
jgi:hypothetical protein